MSQYEVKVITSGQALPDMVCDNFFHSAELFGIVDKTPGQTPYMAVAFDAEGRVAAHLLAIIRRRGSLLPPYFFTQGRVYGEGEYRDDVDRQALFGLLLKAITRKFRRKLCLYVEFSDLSQKMFGYRHFRENGYFPVTWQEIHNSLHSKSPRERISDKMYRRICRLYEMGVVTREVESRDEMEGFYKMLNGFYRMKMRRLIPPIDQFRQLYGSDNAKIFITTFHDKIIGGCACAFSEGNAYLWYLASKRKSHALLHPNMMTIWQALNYAYRHNYAHFFFLDAGLPWRKSPFRSFILSFGGKPVAKYRWFRFSIGWVNRLLTWLYRE